jgi:ABC-type nitrate/sulfonate/bicarbonate transport system ATPase subunit
MIFVTHSIDEAVLMGDRIVILGGHPSHVHDIVEVGIARPRGREVADSERFRVVRDHLWAVVMQGAERPPAPANDPPVPDHKEGRD